MRAAHVAEEVRNPQNPRRGVMISGVPYPSRRSAALALGCLCSEVSRAAVWAVNGAQRRFAVLCDTLRIIREAARAVSFLLAQVRSCLGLFFVS